jgi:prepilin-type N-terminal cleavage/methylation domain-containing protein
MTVFRRFDAGRAARDRGGFTLLEISVVLTIIAVIVGSGLTLFTASLPQQQYNDTQAKLITIQQALYNYRIANNRIPCPADLSIAPTTLNFGNEAANEGSCTGGIPAANFTNATGGGSSGATSASFVKTDSTTKGNWNGVYGASGLVIEASTNSPPSGVTMTETNDSTYTWATGQSAANALLTSNPGNTNTRIAACWYSGSSFSITLNITNSGVYQIAFYLLDWDASGRSETITATNASTSAVLDGPRTASSYVNGQWWVYTISGDVTFTFHLTGGSNAVVSAVLFDPKGTPATAVEGMVPTKTLQLPDDYAFDGWGRRFMYAVSMDVTEANAFSLIPASDSTTRMTVKDASGNAKTTQAAYVVASMGSLGHGAYPRIGGNSRIDASVTNTNQLNNCDCNSCASTTGFDGIFVQMLQTQDSTTPSHTDDFDDTVVFGTRGITLRSPTE